MNKSTLDIRSVTCPGGGALWAFLGHICQMHRGDVVELVTDDPQARTDIPEWANHQGWRILDRTNAGQDYTFVLQKPWRTQRPEARRAHRAATTAS